MTETTINIGRKPLCSVAPSSRLRVVLVNAPWASIKRPSIQCSLMKAVARDCGHRVSVRYLNLELAALIGADLYCAVGDNRHQHALVGEWLFSIAAFGPEVAADSEGYLGAHPNLEELWDEIGFDRATIDRVRSAMLPELVEEWANQPAWADVDVVGFSSTFEQNVASLAVAGALKRRYPRLVTVFGGANLDGVMGREQVRSFDAIDYAVVGEGEITFAALLDVIARRADPISLRGVTFRRDGAVVSAGPAAVVEDLDTSPVPDYDDYFAAVRRLKPRLGGVELGARLPVETARGCWWGQKHHCTFCGLNAETMRFRSKSAERALADLQYLSERHEVNLFEAVDNILDLRYLPGLLRPLAESDYDFSLFYELKANLKREQIRLLAMAGIDTIQPGIESLSTAVLKLMRKGTTALQNIRFLKWALYYGIQVNWNLLMGFPGESEEDYRRQRELLPRLHHLEPPTGAARIWLERFSPLFVEEGFPISDVRPQPAYGFVYPERVDCAELAYFFDYECDQLPDVSHYRKFVAAVEEWKKSWQQEHRPALIFQRGHGWVRLQDSRRGDVELVQLRGAPAATLLACSDRELSAAEIAEALKTHGVEVAAQELERILADLCERELVVADSDQYLSLGIPWRVR